MGTITELQVDIRSEMFNGQTTHDALILRAIGEAIDGIQYAVGADGRPILWDFLKTIYQFTVLINGNYKLISDVTPIMRDIESIVFKETNIFHTPLTFMERDAFKETYQWGEAGAPSGLTDAYSIIYDHPSPAGDLIVWGPKAQAQYTCLISYYQRHATTASTTILVPDLELVKRGAKMRIALDQDNAEVAKMNLEIYDRLFANLMARQQRFEIPRYTVPVY